MSMSKLCETTKPRFSIVIPTYNTTHVLRECISSLSNQSADKSSFEVIVVNDGGEKQTLKDFVDSQLALKYLTQEHRGAAAARNLGIKKARGEIILFLDDDSLPTKDWLAATMKAWEKYPYCDGIGGYVTSDSTDSIYVRVNSDFFNWYLDQNSFNKYSTFLATCNAGYRKDALNKIANFDEAFKGAAGEDRDLNIRILRLQGRLRLDESILVYHDRDLSLRSFARKHFNYGRAARTIYTRYPGLKRLSSKDYVNCYVSILKKYPLFKDKIAGFLLLTLSQLSTLIGYCTARISQKHKKTPIWS